jgi:hypothetical protein
MPSYDFRILLETVEGKKTSYISQSFVDTDVRSEDLVLSSSQVYNRITQYSGSGLPWELNTHATASLGMVSCSFINDEDFVGDINSGIRFVDNKILSASLVGSQNTGSIVFSAVTDEYDRLLRYKFIGDKVCTVLGLPSNQWIYVDQFRLPVDDESNILQGNMNIGNAFVSDTITFANNANVNSDIPFYIDTGSDRYIKFIDTRDFGKVSLIFGYDKDTDTYEINAATGSIFNIKNVNTLQADRIEAAQVNMVTSSTETSLETSFTNLLITGSLFVSGTSGHITASGNISASNTSGVHSFGGSVGIGTSAPASALHIEEGDIRIDTAQNGTQALRFSDRNGTEAELQYNSSTQKFEILTDASDGSGTKRFTIVGGQDDTAVGIGTNSPSNTLTVAGDISASGNLFIDGAISASSINTTIVSSSIIFTSGSNIFGDESSDTHKFVGDITASGNISASGDLILGGKIEIDGGGGLSDAIIEVDSDTLRLKDKGNVNVIIDSDGSAASGEFRVRAHSGESTRFIVSSS